MPFPPLGLALVSIVLTPAQASCPSLLAVLCSARQPCLQCMPVLVGCECGCLHFCSPLASCCRGGCSQSRTVCGECSSDQTSAAMLSPACQQCSTCFRGHMHCCQHHHKRSAVLQYFCMAAGECGATARQGRRGWAQVQWQQWRIPPPLLADKMNPVKIKRLVPRVLDLNCPATCTACNQELR